MLLRIGGLHFFSSTDFSGDLLVKNYVSAASSL